MSAIEARPVSIELPDGGQLSGLVQAPPGATACYVFAHGAGAGMAHRFMADFAQGLADRHIATLRFQFPWMERGGKRPDSPAVAQAAVRAAVAQAAKCFPGMALLAGGKSFGGRMSSQAQAASPLPHVRGLAFVGFPLHAEDKPSIERAHHLAEVKIPMLFLQGTRDGLARLDLLTPVVEGLRPRASLSTFEDADHSFHVRKSSGSTDAQVMASMLDVFADWTARVVE